jgi:pyruvate/2-oxoglutarate dehydrogenase complex dihydrolipoamide dehydrogenase (E3) component
VYDVVIIGGGVAGISCAMVLGSAGKKPFAANKKIAVLTHQKASSLQQAVFYNAYGITPGKTGAELLEESHDSLERFYPHVVQIPNQKVLKLEGAAGNFTLITNKESIQTKMVVVAVGYANTFFIEGLMQYVVEHQKTPPEKNRIQLANHDHLVAEGIYVAGNLAGWRSQLSIAAGSGASVATDILTLWNEGRHTQSHDKIS